MRRILSQVVLPLALLAAAGALLAALRNPAFGFTDSDLAEIRIAAGRKVSFRLTHVLYTVHIRFWSLIHEDYTSILISFVFFSLFCIEIIRRISFTS